MNKQSFLPINNHYSTIDISTLKSNNFKVTTLKREGIEKSSIIKIAKNSDQLLKNSQIKNLLLLIQKQYHHLYHLYKIKMEKKKLHL